MENAGRPSGGCLECFPPSSCSANCLPHLLPTVSFTSSQSFLVAGSLDLQDIFMWITCSNEGCDYGFVVIKVTSLCWLLPPVSSKAVELGGSSRIQAAVPAASFVTGSFPTATAPPPHGSRVTRRRFSSHLLRVSFSFADSASLIYFARAFKCVSGSWKLFGWIVLLWCAIIPTLLPFH